MWGRPYGEIYESINDYDGKSYGDYYFTFGPYDGVGYIYRCDGKLQISSQDMVDLSGLLPHVKVRKINANLKISLEIS